MKLLTTLCCAAVALCGAIYAQSPNDHMVVHFNTPVMIGETKLPAGDCDIQVMHGSSYSVLVLRSAGAPSIEAVALRLSEADTDTGAGPSVILDRRGNDLHLNRIVFSDHTGYQLTNDL
jgi:hypothetical protein